MKRIILVLKKTRYEQKLVDQNDLTAKKLLEAKNPVVRGWEKAHEEHSATVKVVRQALEYWKSSIQVSEIENPHIAFDASQANLVIVVGGDGTFLSASHSVGQDVPILGVNSSPSTSAGFFCAANVNNFAGMLDAVFNDNLKGMTVNRMAVFLNGRARAMRVLNDALFCNSHPAATSRYILALDGRSEDQASSGIWVSTSAGSTGAVKSAGGGVMPLSSTDLQLVVREPIVGGIRTTLVLGSEGLSVVSKMDISAAYLDGPHLEIQANLGDEISFKSGEPIFILGLNERRRY